MNNTPNMPTSYSLKVPAAQLDKYSSACTLSDMEIFIYPELLYSLVLANIMSPVLWRCREDPWFAGLDKMTPYRRVLRLKQYIMDHYDFNLDLDSWGLTSKDAELKRFAPLMDPDVIAASNALFGYTGDQYYFDMNIRKHFGLDKYAGDIIPYWKTETIEAMDAFSWRPGFNKGAGECVSLSTLYAAALFVVAKIPLEDIFLMATPLHSQNFLDLRGGVITNNRRIVTKNMWFNGTELSARAQRALRNEQVTMVAHCSGNIHSVYPQASIDPEAYRRFSERITAFLKVKLNRELLCNFLRENRELQSCFQVHHQLHGRDRWIALEKVYKYEHHSTYSVSNNTRAKLLDSIDPYEFHFEPIDERFQLNDFEQFFQRYPNLEVNPDEIALALQNEFACSKHNPAQLLPKIHAFIQVDPRLPHYQHKQRQTVEPIVLTAAMERADIVDALLALRTKNPSVDLAFYAARDMQYCDWSPFLKAALERNPVAVAATAALSDQELVACLLALENSSIYSAGRLAQPDEVWNFQRGDGIERAICLASIWQQRHPGAAIHLQAGTQEVMLKIDGTELSFETTKGLEKQLQL